MKDRSKCRPCRSVRWRDRCWIDHGVFRIHKRKKRKQTGVIVRGVADEENEDDEAVRGERKQGRMRWGRLGDMKRDVMCEKEKNNVKRQSRQC